MSHKFLRQRGALTDCVDNGHSTA